MILRTIFRCFFERAPGDISSYIYIYIYTRIYVLFYVHTHTHTYVFFSLSLVRHEIWSHDPFPRQFLFVVCLQIIK